jgi:hypothetical protein
MSRKKLSKMSDSEKVEFLVEFHMRDAYSAPDGRVGAICAIASAQMLAKKINRLISDVKSRHSTR